MTDTIVTVTHPHAGDSVLTLDVEPITGAHLITALAHPGDDAAAIARRLADNADAFTLAKHASTDPAEVDEEFKDFLDGCARDIGVTVTATNGDRTITYGGPA